MEKEPKESLSKSDSNYLSKYFQYAETILSSFNGNEPFHLYIKKYFSLNKKHGSRDRKLITSLCYNYFRLGYGVSSGIDFKKKLLLAIFLNETSSSIFLEFFKPEWNLDIGLPLASKLKIVEQEFAKEKIFPFVDELSNEIDSQAFGLSFLIQPKLFIRIRPGFKEVVIEKINNKGLLFEKLSHECLAFANNEKVSSVIEIDQEAVIQDYNSQQTLNLFKKDKIDLKDKITIWDCCAGSGGKSILAFDLFENAILTVSDKRKLILENLRHRFQKARIKNYKLVSADLEKPVTGFNTLFDLIIADVPCSGSGTWSRTPEQLSFFNKNDIEKYSAIQKKIIENALPQLKINGYLLYITCSVFKKENEENITFIQEKFKMSLLGTEYLKGYEMQADTLFAALFRKDA